MKLKTEIIALCEYASISREGKLSIDGVFDELRVEKFPGGIARAFFVATINGKPETSYKLVMKLEHGKEVRSTSNIDAFTSPNGKNNIVTEIVGMGFEKPGDYRFVIYDGKDEVGSTVLKVIDANQTQEIRYKLPN